MMMTLCSRTGLSRKGGLIVQEILDPSHHVVNVCRGRELYTLAILVYPGVVESGKRSSAGYDQRHSLDTHPGPAAIEGQDCCVQHSASTP